MPPKKTQVPPGQPTITDSLSKNMNSSSKNTTVQGHKVDTNFSTSTVGKTGDDGVAMSKAVPESSGTAGSSETAKCVIGSGETNLKPPGVFIRPSSLIPKTSSLPSPGF